MTGAVLYPTLSEDAWVSNSQKTADMMMSHFLTSNYSQTYIYAGYVSSFAYILAINHGDMSAIIAEARRTLSDYFSRFFQNVEVNVSDVTDSATPSKAALELFIQFTDYEGNKYSVGQIVAVTDSTFEKVITINNGA